MLETERLILRPLTYEQLVKYSNLDNSLEEELNLDKSPRSISPELREALDYGIIPNVADEKQNYLFTTLWTLIAKENNKMIGDLCFMGEPNIDGEIEIGYGTYFEFRRKGYMTEAVGEILKWAKTQPKVLKVLANTEKNNLSSQRVLKDNSFSQVNEADGIIYWEIKFRV
ncbi:MAG: GNAT family N-acetyltransferase [Emticicia sp.]|nr:GNAT family N-acetyltransferase [Emticicia sp.]